MILHSLLPRAEVEDGLGSELRLTGASSVIPKQAPAQQAADDSGAGADTAADNEEEVSILSLHKSFNSHTSRNRIST